MELNRMFSKIKNTSEKHNFFLIFKIINHQINKIKVNFRFYPSPIKMFKFNENDNKCLNDCGNQEAFIDNACVTVGIRRYIH